MATLSVPSFHLHFQERAARRQRGEGLAFDRNLECQGWFPQQRLEKWAREPFMRVIRRNDGRIARIYWLPPVEEQDSRHFRLGELSGQRWSYKEHLSDGLRCWTFRRIRYITDHLGVIMGAFKRVFHA